MQQPTNLSKWFILVTTVPIGAVLAQVPTSNTCQQLKSLSLPDTSIVLAEFRPEAFYTVAGRGMAPYAGIIASNRSVPLPAHCRVLAAIKPTADSDIRVEIWLPSNRWNGKFLAVGNGGWTGSIQTAAMAMALTGGYVTASTDTGHEGGSASFALGHPEKLIDYEYRAVREMTTKTKATILSYYGSGARHSYWIGCSYGGEQGLKEAQRYPSDYDGIIAGAPTYYRTHMHAWQVNVSKASLTDQLGYIPPAKYALIHNAVLAACDALDGVKDDLLSDPRRCHFDPGTLLCRNQDSANCLTNPQVEMARRMYAAGIDHRTDRVLYPGLEPGTELAWGSLIGGPEPFVLGNDLFKYLVYKDPNWDWRSFDLSRDTAAADAAYNETLNALNSDLSPFKANGGKLILWHGWSDPLVAPQSTIDYYGSVLKIMGSRRENFIRLFLAPGVQHCGGGPGPNQFNALAALERWVEGGIAPDRMIASHVTEDRVDMTRPLCPYPQIAQWHGTGSTNDVGSFVCKAPEY